MENHNIRLAILSAAVICTLIIANSFAHEDNSGSVVSEKTTQTTCPVLAGNPIDKNIYTDYKGKRVYFCCNSCKSAFIKEPEKYLSNLPQFTSADTQGHNETSHHHNDGLSILPNLIAPMGIITLSLVAITVFLSVFRRINARLMMKWHKRTGITALITGVIHLILVLIAH